MKFRYNTSGTWFKGNTHIHSTKSDGGKTFPELAELYASDNYDFLFRTDHWVASATAEDTESYPLLWMDGVELDGNDHTGSAYHVVCLGCMDAVSRKDGFEATLQSARDQGALTILAHPHWCGNSLEDALRWKFDGVEVYNHVCKFLNGKSCGSVHWDAALMQNPNTLALASDDAHLQDEHQGWNGGWIVVNAPECTSDEIMNNIRGGNFYSSCGPEIHSLSLDGDMLHVETSPLAFARLVGPGSRGKCFAAADNKPIESLDIKVPQDWRYAYLEIEDKQGRRAWTNSLFENTEIED